MPTESPISTVFRTELAAYLKQDVNRISLDHSLRDDLGLDSMETIELLFRIEEAFDLQIPDEDLQRLVTVADVVKYVEGRLTPSPVAQPARKSAKRPHTKKKG